MKVYFPGIFKFGYKDRMIMFEGEYETLDEGIIEKLKSLGFKDISDSNKPKSKTKRAKKKDVNNDSKSK